MSWWKFGGAQAARQKWEAQLHWFRLRYQDSERATHCLKLLSRGQACGRIALYYQQGEPISCLYLGVPELQVRFARQMAADFGLFLQSEMISPPLCRLTAVSRLPWSGGEFVAHLSEEMVFASQEEGQRGSYWPRPASTANNDLAQWCLPNPPLPGLAAKSRWSDVPIPESMREVQGNPKIWPLGWSQTNVPLHTSGALNLYGRQEAVTHWLVAQVVQMLAANAANLAIIDGAGDLVPQLKRKAAVTRLLGEQLAYVDLDSASLMGGFNPLAAAPGESGGVVVQRWQQWFRSIGTPAQSMPLLARAHEDGIQDIPTLRQWLQQQERQGQQTAVAALSMHLNRLTASRSVREWLEWPTNRFENLPAGALFFACKGSSWERRQLLKAALLGVRHVPGVRLILHGLPWGEIEQTLLVGLPSLLVSNGPYLPDSTVVITTCHTAGLEQLRRRFSALTEQVAENVALLAVGEGVILQEDKVVWASWHKTKGNGEQ